MHCHLDKTGSFLVCLVFDEETVGEKPDLTFRLVFPLMVTSASVQTRMTLLGAVVFMWL